jgi:hypothetical protein
MFEPELLADIINRMMPIGGQLILPLDYGDELPSAYPYPLALVDTTIEPGLSA